MLFGRFKVHQFTDKCGFFLLFLKLNCMIKIMQSFSSGTHPSLFSEYYYIAMGA